MLTNKLNCHKKQGTETQVNPESKFDCYCSHGYK